MLIEWLIWDNVYRPQNPIALFESQKILFPVQLNIYWWPLDKSLSAQQTSIDLPGALLDSRERRLSTTFSVSVQGI